MPTNERMKEKEKKLKRKRKKHEGKAKKSGRHEEYGIGKKTLGRADSLKAGF